MHSLPASGTSDESAVSILMKKKLPKYIVKCLQAAGYDEMNTISNVDISENPGNSISKIENYIDRKFSGNLEYVHDSSMLASPFEFPPGHRICNFVRELRTIAKKDAKDEEITKKRKGHTIEHSKRCKIEAEENKPEINVATISYHVRNIITRWVQQQKNPALKRLTENEHYSLSVCPNPAGFFSVSVVCLVCNKSIILHQRDTSNKSSPFIISNWTRHGKNCYVAAYATGSTKNQCNLDKYFGSGRSSQSGGINQEENQAHQTVPRSSDLNNNVSPNSSSSSCMPVSNSHQVF